MPTSAELTLSDLQFDKIRSIIYDNTGISIGDGRTSLLLSRLRSRLRELDEPDFKSYIARVTSDKSELQELINRITTNKTYFFRTPRIWEHFSEVAIEAFHARGTMRPMRVWSAASSTGEEAHSAGITLETHRKTKARFDYKILGTDISSRVVEVAQKGVYAPPALDQFRREQPDLFGSFMKGDDAAGFQVDPNVKSRLSFKLHNLQRLLRNTAAFDVVFLRNVLIYFSAEDQENILRNIHAVMSPDSLLYIGESESISRLKTDFEIVEPMIYKPLAGPGKLAS